jgi:hypothetical protein
VQVKFWLALVKKARYSAQNRENEEVSAPFVDCRYQWEHPYIVHTPTYQLSSGVQSQDLAAL